MTAGSKPSFFAKSGSVQPTTFATRTVTVIVRHTTSATIAETSVFPSKRRSTSITFAKHTADRAIPHKTAVLISFHIIMPMSEKPSSPSERERIIVTDDCEPEFPPVSISIGIKAVRTTSCDKALSKFVIIIPVKVAETIRNKSQPILCLKRLNAEVRR